MEVDIDQAIINLLESGMSQEEVMIKFNLIPSDMTNLTRLFNIGVHILDYHYETIPNLHTQTLLLHSKAGAVGRVRVAKVQPGLQQELPRKL